VASKQGTLHTFYIHTAVALKAIHKIDSCCAGWVQARCRKIPNRISGQGYFGSIGRNIYGNLFMFKRRWLADKANDIIGKKVIKAA